MAGLGLVEARTENVAIGAHVPGVVVDVFVKEGDRVSAGAPLFQIDARAAEAEVRVRQALLSSAQAQLGRLQSLPRVEELPPMQARVAEAQANVKMKRDAQQRSEKLRASGAVADELVIRDALGTDVAVAQLERLLAEDKLLRAGAWEADLAIATAAVAQAEAHLQQAQTERDRLRVVAPTIPDAGEWEVLRVTVRSGEFAGNSAAEPLIVLGDAGPRHVRVDIDENDIPRFQPSASAVAYARGNTDRPYALRFVRVQPFVIPKRSLSGDTAERVDTRVLQAIYVIEEDDRSVFVGQQMDVFIRSEQAPADATRMAENNPGRP
jgi:multidrug efflux pump subunit AcrA (membrane-fusion protein)